VLDVDLANETALHAAACNGHIEVMRWLVEHRVPIDAQSISISRSTCSATARQCVQRTRRRRRPSPMHRGPWGHSSGPLRRRVETWPGYAGCWPIR
jgi:hypothetical protein